MRIALPVLLASLLTASAVSASPATLEEAKQIAARENKPVLVDFYAVWCGPCKAFTAAAQSDAEVQKALEGVVLYKTDAEKEGKELATEQKVQGFPTFVLMRPDGATYERFSGYEETYFLDQLGNCLADLTTIDEKKARFEKAPGADDAYKLATYHETRGEYAEALGFLDRAVTLDPTADIAFTRFEYLSSGFTRQGLFTKEEVVKAADAAVAAPSAGPHELVAVVSIMKDVGQKAKDAKVVVPYLAPALKATEGATDEGLATQHQRLKIDHALYVSGDKDAAVALKRETMPAGWQEDPGQLNAFAWWCFENSVNLAEAEALGRRAVELSPPGDDRASILDTVAEICNARGDRAAAIELMRRAVAEAPGRDYYKKQLQRFEGGPQAGL